MEDAMYTGVVAGTVVSTVKDPGLEGIPLLIVQKIENGKEGAYVVAADHTRQAGLGDHVYMIGFKEASRIFRNKPVPVDVSIVGFIDVYNEIL
ncbi:MAG: EutN/CcmL family microcompartment protein [Muricoprocola sp.]